MACMAVAVYVDSGGALWVCPKPRLLGRCWNKIYGGTGHLQNTFRPCTTVAAAMQSCRAREPDAGAGDLAKRPQVVHFRAVQPESPMPRPKKLACKRRGRRTAVAQRPTVGVG